MGLNRTSHAFPLLFFLGVALCLGASPTWATVLPARTLDQMILDAGQIVRGKVLSKRTFWGANKRHIYTEYKLKVLSTLKGQANTTLKVHVIGGQIGDRISRVIGVSQFTIGEEVVVFLEPKRHKLYQFVLGMSAGKYKVFRQQGQIYLHRSLQGIAFQKPIGQAAKGKSIQEIRQSEAPLAWGQLQQRIQRLQGQIKLRRLRPLQHKSQTLRQRYLQLLRRRAILQKAPTPTLKKPRFGALLPRVTPRHIGAMPTLKRTPQPTKSTPVRPGKVQPKTAGGH